jgi:hypothetical protein
MKSPFMHLIVWTFIGIAVFAAHGFLYSIIAKKSSEVADLQSQINMKTESASRIASARIALAQIANSELTIRSYFIPESEIVSFIGDLEDRGRALGSVVKVLSVSNGNPENQSTLVLSLLIKGTFDSVMRTVGIIEYAPYNLTVTKLSLVKDEKSLWSIDMEIMVGSMPADVSPSTRETKPNVFSRALYSHEYF